MTPRQVFENSFLLSQLLLDVYRLLENERLITEGEFLSKLGEVVGARTDESLLLILNSIFVGVIREEARIHPSTLKPESLNNLLRQAVVSACTAYETYLSSLLNRNIFKVIGLKQHEFFPNDAEVNNYFKEIFFSIGDAFRLLSLEERSVFLGSKIVSYVQKKNLGSVNGLRTVGLLLGLEDPWRQIADRLNRETREITKVIKDCLERRNSIVHRSDRILETESDERQAIVYSWTSQAVDTIRHVCLAFDELVCERMRAYETASESAGGIT